MPRLRSVPAVPGPLDALHGQSASGDDYDPLAFYVEAQDKHGHDVNQRVRLNPRVVSEVSRLIASGALAGTPIEGLGAFIRDAMHHNLERIKGFVHDDPMLVAAAADARRIARADGLVAEMKGKRKIVDDAESSFDDAMKADDDAALTQLVELYEPMVDRLRDPYGTELEEHLKRTREWQRKQANKK